MQNAEVSLRKLPLEKIKKLGNAEFASYHVEIDEQGPAFERLN